MESLETRLMFSVTQDANGWTVVTPSGGERIIYVSSSQGSDSNSGFSSSAPVKSFTKAESLLINNAPNEILLKSGDTFNDSFQNWKYSGADAQDPIAITYYGTGARPLIYSGTAGTGFSTPGYSNTGTVVNYLDVLGLQFDANLRDPTLATVNTSFAGGQTGFYFYANGGNVLVEGCSFSYYRLNFDIEAIAGTNYTSPSISNITIRRTVDVNSYAFNGGRSQGLYAYNINGLTITQSVFDHDGWNAAYPYLGATDIGYNHDIYIASTCSGINISNDIIAEASYAGIMARAGGIIDDDMFIDNAVAVSFGAADGADSKVGGVSGQLVGNTVVGDKAEGSLSSSPLAFGQGFVLANTAPGANVLVANNIFTQDSQNAKPAIQLEVPTGTSNPASAVGINNLTISGNIANGWRVGIQTDGRFVAGGTGLYALNALTVSKNDFINNSTQEVRHDGAFATTQESWSGDRFYDTVLKQSGWITLQSASLAFNTWKGTYDIGALALNSLPYQNPNVSVATYDALLGGPGTFQDFLAQADQLSIYNYRPQYMGPASVSYIQAGFNVSSGYTGTGPGTPPTAAVSATSLNASAIGSTALYTFVVNYTDGSLLTTSSLGNKNLLVDGPNGFSQYATYVSAAAPTYDAAGYQHIAATYEITPPGGIWLAGDDGTYTIDMLANQVTDSSGNVAADAVIGSFGADFTLPTAVATVTNVSSSALGTTSYGFSVTYSDSAGVDTSTLNSGQVQVTGPNGFNRYATLISETTLANGSVAANYTITAPGGSWSTSANGTYTVTMAANSVYDLAGNAVTGGTLATFNANLSGNSSNTGTASISGTVFNDANGNGVLDARENLLTGVTVFIDLAGTGVYTAGDPVSVTDINGNYSFTNLPAGRYTVVEQAPSGFTVTSPTTGSSTITVTSTQTVTGLNFANQIGTTVTSGGGGGSNGGGGHGPGSGSGNNHGGHGH